MNKHDAENGIFPAVDGPPSGSHRTSACNEAEFQRIEFL